MIALTAREVKRLYLSTHHQRNLAEYEKARKYGDAGCLMQPTPLLAGFFYVFGVHSQCQIIAKCLKTR